MPGSGNVLLDQIDVDPSDFQLDVCEIVKDILDIEENAVDWDTKNIAPIPAEEPVAVVGPPRREGSVVRHALNHRLWVLPEKSGEKGKFEISDFVISVAITEELNKDVDVKITLDNTDFLLNDVVFLEKGHRLQVELFDGQDWEDFGDFIIVSPGRSYADSVYIELDCRSKLIKMQRGKYSFTWSDTKISDAVAEVSRAAGFEVDVDPTDENPVGSTLKMRNESARTFVNRMAKKTGYEYYVRDGILHFKKPGAKLSSVVLKYRPDFPEVGTIISAGIAEDGSSNKGSKNIPKARSVDFKAGTIGEDVLAAIQTHGLRAVSNVLEPVSKDEQRQISQFDNEVLSMLGAGIDPAEDDEEDTGSDLPDGITYLVPDLKITATPDEATRIVKQIHNSNSYKYALSLTTYGMADLRPRTIVTVEGLSNQDDGRWLITKATRNYSTSGYMIGLECKRHKKRKAKKRAAASGATATDQAAPSQTGVPTENPNGKPPEIWLYRSPFSTLGFQQTRQ